MAGSGPFGLITNLFGERDVRDDIADYQTQQLIKNRAAAGMDAEGNLLPPQPAGAAPVPIQTQDPSQTPNAHKTPADLGTMLMRLGQQEERNQGFNQALGLGFAAFAQPRDREMVSRAFNTNLQDPNALGKTLFEANSQQAGQDQTNAIRMAINDPQRGPLIAQKLNMTWEALKAAVAADPGAAGKIAAQLGMPTEDIRNLSALGVMGGGGAGATDANGSPLTDARKQIISRIGGQPEMTSAQEAWRAKHPGRPDSEMGWEPNNVASFTQWQINEKAKEETRGKSAENLPAIQQKSEELRNNLEKLKAMPALEGMMNDPVKREAIRTALKGEGGWADVVARNVFNDDEKAALALMKQVSGGQYSEALHSLVGTGTRVTQQEVNPLSASIGLINEPNMNYDTYIKQAINPLITRTKRIVASAFGSTGNLTAMPEEYAPWMHPTYRKGGELYKEGGGADDLPPLMPVPDDILAKAKKEVTGDASTKDDVLDGLQQSGFDVAKLRKKPASAW